MKLFAKNKPDSSISNAKSLYTKGNYKKALKICKNILDEKDYDFEAQNLLGDIYYKMGNKSKALEMYRTLGEKLEQDKFTERAIAVTRKIIRFYPEQFDLYRKLSKLYRKKGLIADQLNILYELSDIYHEKNEKDKSVDILKEIAEIDRNTAENYYKIISRFCEYGKTEEVCKYSYYAAKLASEQNKKNILNKIMDIAIDNNCDLTNIVKYSVMYFKDNPDKLDIFKSYAKAYLLENFDSNFFEDFIEFFNYSDDPDFFNTLKEKYGNITIYKYILENLLNNNELDKIPGLVGEIIDIPDYNFDASIIDVVQAGYSTINSTEVLDSLATLAEKCDTKDLSIGIYKRMRDLYEEDDNTEKSEMLTQFISDLENSPVLTDTSTELSSVEINPADEDFESEEETDFSGLEDLIEHTTIEEDSGDSSDPLSSLDTDMEDSFDNNFFEEDTEKHKNAESDISPENNEFSDNTVDNNHEEETDIELDLSDLTTSEEEKNQPEHIDEMDINDLDFQQDSEENDILPDLELNDEFDENNDVFSSDGDTVNNSDEEFNDGFSKAMEELEIDEINEDDIFDITNETDENIDSSKNSRVKEVEELISSGHYDAAQKELDLLLEEKPDDERLKDLATQLILIEEDDEINDKSDISREKKENLKFFATEFSNIASAIRKSINEKIDPEDYEAHYDMAMAYMEMELYEDALEELKKAATSDKRYESLFLMAECHKRMKEYQEAVNLHKLIVVDYSETEKVLNSLYEIANIYEMKGNFSTAFNYYNKIYVINENFRDVKEKIKDVSPEDSYELNSDKKTKEFGISSANEEYIDNTNHAKKKKKISYL